MIDRSVQKLGSYRIVENTYMVIQNGYKYIPRSWKERLFSWPWTPWEDMKRVPNMEPDPDMLTMPGANGIPNLVGHPETVRHLKNRLDEAKGKE